MTTAQTNTYFPNEIFKMILDYSGLTLEQKQKKIWDSIRVKWDECFEETAMTMDNGDIEGFSLGRSKANCFLYDKTEDFVWCFNPVCYQGRFNPYTYSVKSDDEPIYQYPVHSMFENYPVHHYELEVLEYNYKSLNDQFKEETLPRVELEYIINISIADNALFDLWEDNEAEYLNEIV